MRNFTDAGYNRYPSTGLPSTALDGEIASLSDIPNQVRIFYNGLWLPLGGDYNGYFVDPANGSNAYSGRGPTAAFRTLEKAVDSVTGVIGERIYMAPGRYDESVTIARAKSNITLIGTGGRGSVYIDPSTEDATGLDVRADDVTLINVGVAGEDEDAAFALRVYGARFRAYSSKFEGAAFQIVAGPGTVAQTDADTHGNGADALFVDCEICWGDRGVDLVSSDYGAVTQFRMRDCHFHNLTTCHVRSNDVAASNICLRNVWLDDCIFDNAEDGTEPTDYLLLNTTNDTGRIVRPIFATSVLASAKITLATGVLIFDWHTEQEGAPASGGTAGRPD